MASMQSTSTLHVSSILKTLSTAAPSVAAQADRQQAARQLAGLDPKRFLANLQAAVNRSPQAIVALKEDMHQLEGIFYKLSRAGHDVSSAQRDFLMLKQFVGQLAAVDHRRPPPLPLPPSSTSSRSQRPAQHARSSSLPTPAPVSQEQFTARPSGSYNGGERRYREKDLPSSLSSSTRRSHQDPRYVHLPIAHGSTQGPSGPSFPASSTSSASSSSSSSRYSPSANVLSPIPSRLVKPRRMSAPAVVPCAKKVHFASHATVYTYRVADASGRDYEPPSRPSHVPRAEGFFAADGRPRF